MPAHAPIFMVRSSSSTVATVPAPHAPTSEIDVSTTGGRANLRRKRDSVNNSSSSLAQLLNTYKAKASSASSVSSGSSGSNDVISFIDVKTCGPRRAPQSKRV
ncbi:hypothetical protein HK101_003889 [Irineochytrium annulatum]|nr:hypothetical protein HK101_003889 [Irineochytrium annulatum]